MENVKNMLVELTELKGEIIGKKDFFRFCEMVCTESEKNYIVLEEDEHAYYGTVYVSEKCSIKELQEFKGKLASVIVDAYYDNFEPEKKYYKKRKLIRYLQEIRKNIKKEIEDLKKNKEVSEKIKEWIK